MIKILFRAMVSLLIVLLALVITLLVDPLRENTSFLVFLGSVTLTARYGGIYASVFASVLSCGLWIFFVSEPRFHFDVSSSDLVRLLAFLGTATLVSYYFSQYEKKEAESEFMRKQLETLLSRVKLGVWEYDVSKEVFWATESLFPLAGLKGCKHGKLSFSVLHSIIHGDDREVFALATSKALETGKSVDLHVRLANPGKVMHVFTKVNQEFAGRKSLVIAGIVSST